MTVSPGYFEVFKIPVKRGRTFDERDDCHVAAGGDHQRGDGEAVLGRQGSAERSADHRPRHHAGVRGRAGSADHRRGRRHPQRRPRQRARPDDVHSAGAGAGRGQRAQPAAVADGLAGAHADRAAAIEQRHPGAAAPVDRPAGVRRAVDGRGRVAVGVAAEVQHVADDASSAARRCCWRRSASTA